MLESEPVKVTSTERNFRVDLITNFFDYYDTWENIHTSLTFTNATLNFVYTFINTEGANIEACLNVRKRTTMADTLINETCITAASGTILVNIGEPGDDTFIGTGTIMASPPWVSDILFKTFNVGYKRWGKDGILAAFFVRTTLAMVGIWNPVVAVILLLVADFSMVSMGIYVMNAGVFIFYIVLGGIVLYRVGRK